MATLSNTSILITLSGDDLSHLIRECVVNAIEGSKLNEAVFNNEIIDSKTLMQRLDISEPTLQRWRDRKRIPYIQEDSVIRYNWPKVLEALEKRKGGAK